METNEPLVKRIGYVAHQIHGDAAGNIQSVLGILEEIRLNTEGRGEWESIIPIAPYLVALLYLDDDDPEQRALGIEENNYYLGRGFIDVLILAGPTISQGMYDEIEKVVEYNRQAPGHTIDIMCHNLELQPELDRILEEIENKHGSA